MPWFIDIAVYVAQASGLYILTNVEAFILHVPRLRAKSSAFYKQGMTDQPSRISSKSWEFQAELRESSSIRSQLSSKERPSSRQVQRMMGVERFTKENRKTSEFFSMDSDGILFDVFFFL